MVKYKKNLYKIFLCSPFLASECSDVRKNANFFKNNIIFHLSKLINPDNINILPFKYLKKIENKNLKKKKKNKNGELGIGDWGLGIGDWGLGPFPIP